MFTYLIFRGDIAHYRRRVPEQFSHVDSRTFVKKSLKTKDPQEAQRKALNYNKYIETYWQSLVSEHGCSAQSKYTLATKNAEILGFNYKTAAEISDSDINRIALRILEATKAIECADSVSAILGGQNHPKRFLEELWESFYKFKKATLRGKSDAQIKRWVNPRIRAYKTFIEVCGDIPIDQITRDHILNFRDWWSLRIQDGMAPNSANKDLTHLRSILAHAQDNWKGISFDVTSLFARIRFEETDSKRMPFETGFIRSELLNHRNLTNLNDECRLFLFAMADTGARPSELLGLNAARGDIRLDTETPYIHIRPDDDREIKNKYSNRQIPLVGSALYAFKQMAQGFNQYYCRPDQLSSNLNKFLREHDLTPTDNHCVYSLRHSFEDRLGAVDTPEKVHSMIMGHSYRRERYGIGPSLEQKKKWMNKMCFKEFE